MKVLCKNNVHVLVFPWRSIALQQVKNAWAGYYDYNTFDQNLIIGNHPYRNNFYMACGSSGHGIQHAVPIGLAVAELIIEGKYENIDLSRLSFDRVVEDAPLYESNIVWRHGGRTRRCTSQGISAHIIEDTPLYKLSIGWQNCCRAGVWIEALVSAV